MEITPGLPVSFTATLAGLAPASGGGTTNFLRADGTWAAAGGGTTTNALTLNSAGTGAASGSTFNGSAAITLSYNTLGAAPIASPTFTGKVTTPVSVVGSAGLSIPSGTAPTTPNVGDMWMDTNGLSARFGTATMQVAGNWTDLGPNTLYSTSAPAAPVQGVRIYGIKRANRHMIGWITPTGRTERVAPWLGSNNRVEYAAQINTATYTSSNAVFAVVIAATALPFSTTNYLTAQRRNQQTISTAGGMVEQFGPLMCARLPGNGAGGFHMAWRFGIVALNTDAKLFCGLNTAVIAMTNVNPSTLFSIVGLGKDATDTTTLAFFANGGSGTAQKIALPNTGTMTGIANTWWQVEIFCKAGDTQFGYRISRTSSAGVETNDEGVTTGTQNGAAGIPADATAFAPHLWACSTTAVATTINFSQFFLETD